MSKEKKLIADSSSHSSGNTNVVRRLEGIMSKFGEVHNMLARTNLSKEDYQPISSLLATAKVELFNLYYEFKNKQDVQMDKNNSLD